MNSTQVDQSSLDQLTRLLDGSSSGGSLLDTDSIISAIQPYIVALTVLSFVIGTFYIIHLIQKMRVNHAIMETRDILREMNQRQKGEPASLPKSNSQTVSPERPDEAELTTS